MALKKNIFTVMLTITIVAMAALSVCAENHPILDVDASGSITMTHLAEKTQKPIAGSEMTLYKVADAKYNEGKYPEYNYGDAIFDPISELASDSIRKAMNKVTEADAGSYELAAKLESLVKSEGISGTSKVTGSDGVAKWNDLSVGLYLIVNTKPAEGYEAIPSFVISVPRLLDEDESGNVDGVLDYLYNVTTEPKPAPATECSDDDQGNGDDDGDTRELAQTGQLWWPVPALAAGGFLLIGVGLYRRKHA
ncbi:MAG: pilin N-terminal domain-containing protein [Mogibacterium sp.]|nr:pilin N-terminal domain-containing protein [Mogibacterium sp.]